MTENKRNYTIEAQMNQKNNLGTFMKIRNLLIKVKQKQIIANNPYIFVFHCSGLTNLQWRQLKLLLQNTFRQATPIADTAFSAPDYVSTNQNIDGLKMLSNGAEANTFFQRGGLRSSTNVLWRLRRAVRLRPSTKRINAKKKAVAPSTTSRDLATRRFRLAASPPTSYLLQHKKKAGSISLNRTYITATLKHFAKNKTTSRDLASNMRGRKAYADVVNAKLQRAFQSFVKTKQPELLQQHMALPVARLAQGPKVQKDSKQQPGPFCLLYSTHNTTDKSSAPWSDLLTSINNSFEYKANLVLLYGHINSNQLANHIDIKESMSLDTQNVLGLFLQSINFSTHYLDLCLNSKTTVSPSSSSSKN
jgi:hypothetical protein